MRIFCVVMLQNELMKAIECFEGLRNSDLQWSNPGRVIVLNKLSQVYVNYAIIPILQFVFH